METIRVGYADFWPEWPQENFIEPILKKHFNVIVDQKNPDLLIHSIFNARRDTPKYKCKKLLVLAENWRPGPIGSDFSISFDPHSETNFRLPLWQIYGLLDSEIKKRLFGPRLNHEKFSRFAAFTVSNPSNFLRNGAFHELNRYKKVHSYGKLMTNDDILIKYSQGKYWRDTKDAFFLKNPHKFMMTYENNAYPGYTTEKIMDAFLTGSIPIYWGSPTINNEFNPKAFVNAMSNSDWVNQVKRLDTNKGLFEGMYNEPIFTTEQAIKHRGNMDNFASFLIRIIKEG